MSSAQAGFGAALGSIGEFFTQRALSMAQEQDFEKKQRFLQQLEEENAKKVPTEKRANYTAKQWEYLNKYGDVIRTTPMTQDEIDAHELDKRKDVAGVGKAESDAASALFTQTNQQETYNLNKRNVESEISYRAAEAERSRAAAAKDKAAAEDGDVTKELSPKKVAVERQKRIQAQFDKLYQTHMATYKDDLEDHPFDPEAATEMAAKMVRSTSPELFSGESASPPQKSGNFIENFARSALGFGRANAPTAGPKKSAVQITDGAKNTIGATVTALRGEARDILNNPNATPKDLKRLQEIRAKLQEINNQL